MATKAIARRRSQGMTIPVAVIGGLLPAAGALIEANRSGGMGGVLQWSSILTTGYDPADGSWKPGIAFRKLYGPLALGFVVHKLAGRLGINRALGRAGVPLIRI